MPHPDNIPRPKNANATTISVEEMEKRAAEFSKRMREDELKEKKEKLAAMAMQGILANPSLSNENPMAVAHMAVRMAEALLEKL